MGLECGNGEGRSIILNRGLFSQKVGRAIVSCNYTERVYVQTTYWFISAAMQTTQIFTDKLNADRHLKEATPAYRQKHAVAISSGSSKTY